ncbi:MAG: DNA primase [bacterium]|nr:DNA primase [bacterium]
MNLFSFIKARIAILDVVQEFTTLKKAGAYWKARCPFHHEKTASFTVSPHKDIFYCFGCHTGGDIITFIQKAEHCSPFEAAQYLAQRYNIELPSSITQQHDISETSAKARTRYFDICKYVALWCHDNLQKNPSLIHYLHDRGFIQESIDLFSLGFFPGGLIAIKSLLHYMQTHNILAQDLIEANIIAHGKTVMYSAFENRLIFPIKDHLGRFCAFGGRIFKDHDERPKYYNSHENEYFTKGNLLFGLDLAKKEIQKTGTLFLVEGYTDCIAMVQHGFTNTVATLGTACTNSHLKLLSRYAQQMYVLYDGDTAGQQAVLRLTELCWQVDLELQIICLPAGQDPASFLAQKGDLNSCIKKAKEIFVFFIDSIGKNFATKLVPEKVHVTRKLVDIIRTIDDPLKQDFLLQKAAKTFDIPFETLKQELGRPRPPLYGELSDSPELPTTVETPPSLPTLEKRIFCAIISDMSLINNDYEKYLINYMPRPLRAILRQLHETKQSNPSLDFDYFFNVLGAQEQHYISKLLLEYDQKIEKEEFHQLTLQLQKKRWKFIVRDFKMKLTEAKQEGNSTRVEEILQDFLKLKQKIVPLVANNQVKN